MRPNLHLFEKVSLEVIQTQNIQKKAKFQKFPKTGQLYISKYRFRRQLLKKVEVARGQKSMKKYIKATPKNFSKKIKNSPKNSLNSLKFTKNSPVWSTHGIQKYTVHPPICQLFISRKSVDKSGFVDKSGES